jgi:hypothetical protein
MVLKYFVHCSFNCRDVEEVADASGLLTALNVESMSDETGFIVVECLERESFKLIGMSETIQSSEEVGKFHKRYLVKPKNSNSPPSRYGTNSPGNAAT